MSQPKKPALWFIFVTLVLIILGYGFLIPVIPVLVTQFEGHDTARGASWYGLLVASYATMQFVAAPILGSLSDMFGRRRVILIALAGSAVDYVIMGLAPSLGWLFVARLISGVTAGALATCNAYIADVTPPEKRAAGFGLVGAAFGVGFVVGPALGGLLGGVSPRLPFFVAAGCVGLNWLYGAFVLPESLPVEKRRSFSWKRANPIASLQHLRKFRGVADLAWMYFLCMFAQVILQAMWVIYMGYRYGWGTREVGISLAIAGIAAGAVQGGLVKPIIGWLGERKGLVVGLVVTALAYTGYGLASHGWMIYAIIAVGSIGGIAGPASQALITRHVPADEQGAVQGSLSGLQSLSMMVAPMIATASFSYCIKDGGPVHIPGIAFFEGAVLMGVAVILALASFRADDRLSAASAAQQV